MLGLRLTHWQIRRVQRLPIPVLLTNLYWLFGMKVSIHYRYRFRSDIVNRAVWLYCRFTLSFRDVEELMIECSVDVC